MRRSPLSTIAAQILAGGLDAALVVCDSVLVGIVTSTHVLTQLAEHSHAETEDHLEP
jgi:hypothetical protein